MASKPSQKSISLPHTHRKRRHRVVAQSRGRRDRDTNVYIPTDAEVIALKAWSEYCKL